VCVRCNVLMFIANRKRTSIIMNGEQFDERRRRWLSDSGSKSRIYARMREHRNASRWLKLYDCVLSLCVALLCVMWLRAVVRSAAGPALIVGVAAPAIVGAIAVLLALGKMVSIINPGLMPYLALRSIRRMKQKMRARREDDHAAAAGPLTRTLARRIKRDHGPRLIAAGQTISRMSTRLFVTMAAFLFLLGLIIGMNALFLQSVPFWLRLSVNTVVMVMGFMSLGSFNAPSPMGRWLIRLGRVVQEQQSQA